MKIYKSRKKNKNNYNKDKIDINGYKNPKRTNNQFKYDYLNQKLKILIMKK
jgi:hypothetical protein